MNDYIKREDATEAVWRVLNGMGISQKHNDRLVEEVDAVVDDIPAADVRPVEWKSVREHTPEPGRYLTCRKTSTIPHSYYQSILSYTDNLESVDEYDFEGENVPGWFEYDSEYGHYSCDNVEWFMPLPPMPINCGAMMEES